MENLKLLIILTALSPVLIFFPGLPLEANQSEIVTSDYRFLAQASTESSKTKEEEEEEDDDEGC